MTNKTAHEWVVLIIISFVVQLLMIGYVFYASYEGRKTTVTNQRAGCERSKLDRAANAKFQKAQTEYNNVVAANSANKPIKRAALDALPTFKKTSKELEIRSKSICAKVFPKARLLP